MANLCQCKSSQHLEAGNIEKGSFQEGKYIWYLISTAQSGCSCDYGRPCGPAVFLVSRCACVVLVAGGGRLRACVVRL